MRERFGLDLVVLRSIVVPSEVDDDDEFRFTENVGDDPADGLDGWIAEPALAGCAMAEERDRSAALRWFTERRTGGPDRLEPWQREGWFEEAATWVRSTLPGVTTIEQVSSWSGSALLRIEAGDGRCYLKAAPGYFRNEGPVTAMLADRFPDAVPRPVAVDLDRGWMVLRDFGDELLESAGPDRWEEALDTMASIQRASVAMIGDLLHGGCRDRRPRVLLAQIEALAAGSLGSIPDGYPARMLAAIPRFDTLGAELEASPIPATLVHGDFHRGNVAIHDGRSVIFDWTDASIAHPFVDLLTFFDMSGPPTTDVAVRDRLLERYLESWTDVMPRRDAAALFRRTEPFITMHHVISYQEILTHLDPTERWQWESHVPWWLDKALAGFA
jgi:hypothetical protein